MGYRVNYDVFRAFENVPDIMGLDLTRKNRSLWYGACYMNGENHAFRKDKIKVNIYNRDIWVHEEGGSSIPLAQWLVQYGRASDYREAYDILEDKMKPLQNFTFVKKSILISQYVPKSVVVAMKQFDLRKCALFRWMCTLFAEDDVREVWDMYNVTTDSKGLAVFWYADDDGRIAFDKRVKYKEDGHRDKSFGGTREYRTADGFISRPYFGAHLVKDSDEVKICESEKSCLLATLAYGGTWLATGGKTSLKTIYTNSKLYPDYDAVIDWRRKGGEIVEWWQGWDACGKTSDIGDLIEWSIKHKQ